MTSKIGKSKKPFPNPFEDPIRPEDDPDNWTITDGGERGLPRIGQRCLFETRLGAEINGRTIKEGFRFFGYRDENGFIYAPLYDHQFTFLNIKAWMIAPGMDFWKGISLMPKRWLKL